MIQPLWESLAASREVERTLGIQPRDRTPRCLPKRDKNLCSHKNLYANVYNSLIQYSQKLETTQNVFTNG